MIGVSHLAKFTRPADVILQLYDFKKSTDQKPLSLYLFIELHRLLYLAWHTERIIVCYRCFYIIQMIHVLARSEERATETTPAGLEQTLGIIQTERLGVGYQDTRYSSPGINIWGSPVGHFSFSPSRRWIMRRRGFVVSKDSITLNPCTHKFNVLA